MIGLDIVSPDRIGAAQRFKEETEWMFMEQGIIEILKQEHEEILRFIGRLRKQCIDFMEEDTMDMKEFRRAVEFIRMYADKRHHQKEEQILFTAMAENLGSAAVKLVQNGMLVEHDLARLSVDGLEKALNAYENDPCPENKLDILANATGYYYLLKRHAEKENEIVFPFAQRGLTADQMKKLNAAAVEYERAFIKKYGI